MQMSFTVSPSSRRSFFGGAGRAAFRKERNLVGRKGRRGKGKGKTERDRERETQIVFHQLILNYN